MNNVAIAGECLIENFKLEYQIIELEYICQKSLKIEAVCLNPYSSFDKEVFLKFETNNLKVGDKRLQISLMMIDNTIKNLKLEEKKLRKLMIKNGEVFFISKV